MHYEELHNLISSRNFTLIKSQEDEASRPCGTNGEEEKCTQDLSWKTKHIETNLKAKA